MKESHQLNGDEHNHELHELRKKFFNLKGKVIKKITTTYVYDNKTIFYLILKNFFFPKIFQLPGMCA